jgi:hypothetical protein
MLITYAIVVFSSRRMLINSPLRWLLRSQGSEEKRDEDYARIEMVGGSPYKNKKVLSQ